MRRLLRKLPFMPLFRAAGRPRPLPVSLALSVTHRCNARCKTCDVAGGLHPEMDLEQWHRIFDSMGRAPVWVTITGGEPFLRKDLDELCRALVKRSKPRFVTLATNGSATGRINYVVRALAKEFPATEFLANISLDGIGAAHDEMRGLPGSFDAALATFHALNDSRPDNLHVAFHTAVSKYNIAGIRDLIVYAREFNPDAHVFEPAQARAELNVEHNSPAPDVEAFEELLPALKAEARRGRGGPTELARRGVRGHYYDLALGVMREQKQVIPCYAGFSSAHIAPHGEVWACCTLAQSMGNLQEINYDFPSLWRSRKAARVRAPIAAGRCHCTMANAMFTSMLFDPRTAVDMAAGALGNLRP